MGTQELRLKLIEIVAQRPGLSSTTVIDIAKQYEAYITEGTAEVIIPSVSDKAQAPDGSQEEGRIGMNVSSKKKPR